MSSGRRITWTVLLLIGACGFDRAPFVELDAGFPLAEAAIPPPADHGGRLRDYALEVDEPTRFENFGPAEGGAGPAPDDAGPENEDSGPEVPNFIEAGLGPEPVLDSGAPPLVDAAEDAGADADATVDAAQGVASACEPCSRAADWVGDALDPGDGCEPGSVCLLQLVEEGLRCFPLESTATELYGGCGPLDMSAASGVGTLPSTIVVCRPNGGANPAGCEAWLAQTTLDPI